MITMASTMALPEAMLAPMSLLGRYSIFFAAVPVRSDGSFLASVGTTPSSVASKAHTSFAGDEIDALDARVGVEEAKDGLGVGGAAGTGDADCDDFAAGFGHGWLMNH